MYDTRTYSFFYCVGDEINDEVHMKFPIVRSKLANRESLNRESKTTHIMKLSR